MVCPSMTNSLSPSRDDRQRHEVHSNDRAYGIDPRSSSAWSNNVGVTSFSAPASTSSPARIPSRTSGTSARRPGLAHRRKAQVAAIALTAVRQYVNRKGQRPPRRPGTEGTYSSLKCAEALSPIEEYGAPSVRRARNDAEHRRTRAPSRRNAGGSAAKNSTSQWRRPMMNQYKPFPPASGATCCCQERGGNRRHGSLKLTACPAVVKACVRRPWPR